MTQEKELKVGTMVAFSSGCYSDYSVSGFARVLKPINRAVWDEMCAAVTVPPSYDPKGEPRFDRDKAVPWFIANGYVEEVEYHELHLGDYLETPSWVDA